MKRMVLILVGVMLMMLSSCDEFVMEQESQSEPLQEISFEPTADWEEALVEYLMQFPPIFRNTSLREGVMGIWWASDWHDFVEWITDGRQENYGYDFIFRDAVTGQRIFIEDMPYLNRRIWYDSYGEQTGSRSEIAIGFRLFDLDGSGIPMLIIDWKRPTRGVYPGGISTLHRFNDGVFEFAAELSTWDGISFYRGADGRLFIEHTSTVAHMIDLRLLHLNDEITMERALYTDGYTTTVYNYLTGEYFVRYPGSPLFVGIDAVWHEELLEALLGMSLTRIEQEEALQKQLLELISSRLTQG